MRRSVLYNIAHELLGIFHYSIFMIWTLLSIISCIQDVNNNKMLNNHETLDTDSDTIGDFDHDGIIEFQDKSSTSSSPALGVILYTSECRMFWFAWIIFAVTIHLEFQYLVSKRYTFDQIDSDDLQLRAGVSESIFYVFTIYHSFTSKDSKNSNGEDVVEESTKQFYALIRTTLLLLIAAANIRAVCIYFFLLFLNYTRSKPWYNDYRTAINIICQFVPTALLGVLLYLHIARIYAFVQDTKLLTYYSLTSFSNSAANANDNTLMAEENNNIIMTINIVD